MSKLTDYKGDVLVEVAVAWRLDKAPDAIIEDHKGDKDFVLHQFANLSTDRVSTLLIHRADSQPSVPAVSPLVGFASETRRLYDADRNTYELGPINTYDLQGLIDCEGVESGLVVDVSFTIASVFDAILEAWAATGTVSLANRLDTDPILSLFKLKNDGRVQYTETHHRIQVPAKLLSYSYDDPAGFPVVRLFVLLSLGSKSQRLLAAASWTTLSSMPVKPSDRHGSPIDSVLDVCRWILCNLSAKRGLERIMEIVDATKAIPNDIKLVTEARAQIDKCLIVANHWHGVQEDSTSERYQARMSNFFGRLYKKYFWASPVVLIRRLAKGVRSGLGLIPLDDFPSIWAQAGVGHCGEHADVGYAVLVRLVASSGGTIRSVVLAGNANIDHAFVLVNIEVEPVSHTRTLNTSSCHELGGALMVFDLENSLLITGGDPPVLDAYLQFDSFEAKASKLLKSLLNKKDPTLETRFVQFYKAHPNEPRKVIRTAEPDAILKGDFPNI